MHLTSALLVLQSSLVAAAPRIPALLSIREEPEAFTPPKVLSLSLSGNGCPQGSTEVSTANLWENFSVNLPAFKIAIGGSSTVQEKTVNCQAHLNVASSTSGWQFALKDLWSTGRLELEGSGVTLSQYVTVYYSQNAANSSTTHQSFSSTTNSTIAEVLRLHTAVPTDAIIWSPCNGESGILNVNFRMAFTSTNHDASGYYGGGRNSSVNQRWGWTWRRC
ncbi:hypothetical protein HD806DRAFT_530202 [Xylariaceae sp. AK1471]|nr:hypothetical protein HD806DRAFT_530202 [Xylariaceae sp. AK1471]